MSVRKNFNVTKTLHCRIRCLNEGKKVEEHRGSSIAALCTHRSEKIKTQNGAWLQAFQASLAAELEAVGHPGGTSDRDILTADRVHLKPFTQ